MSNSEIRNRAWQIYKNNLPVLVASTLALTTISLAADKIGNSVISLALTVITAVLQMGIFYMVFRTWVEGYAAFSHLSVPFTQPVYRKKLLPVLLVQNGVVLLSAVPLFALLLANMNDPFFIIMNYAIILLLLVLILLTGIAVALMTYIYIMQPEMKTADILKKSALYIFRHLGEYLWFGFTLILIPVLITALMTELLGATLVTLLLVPADTYISLARTGFVYERILLVEQAKENPIPVAEEPFTENVLPPVETTLTEADTRHSDEEI